MKYLIENPITIPLNDKQRTIYNAALDGKNIAVPACAGSGKTHTADAVCHNINKRVELIPFAVSLFEEQSKKFAKDDHIEVLNQHKRGKRMLPARIKVDFKKVLKLAENEYDKHGKIVSEIVEKCKIEAVGLWENALTVSEVIAKYFADFKDAETFDYAKAASHILELSDKDTSTIDYTDMLRMPVVMGIRKDVGDAFVVLDEVQDFTPMAWVWLRECVVSPDTHVLMIGDPERQALMQFAGASVAVFDEMTEFFNCEALNLNENRRCAKAIVDAAPYAGDMIASDDAPEGEVTMQSCEEVIQEVCDGLYSNDAILSETNAPLVTLGIKLLTSDVPVQMRTKKIESLLFKYAYKHIVNRKLKVGDIAPLLQQDLAEAAADGCDDLGEFQDVVKCVDALETFCIAKGLLKTTFEYRKPVHPLQQALKALTGNGEGITLMTGHTAKGLEWNTVFHLPSKVKAPEQEWQVHQNQCVAHVIATRARLRHVTLMVEG